MHDVDSPEPAGTEPTGAGPSGTVVVVAGGEVPDRRLRSLVPEHAIVIAADSGVDHALDLGLRVTTVVGDLDSASAEGLAAARAAAAEVVAYPVDKDATDLELALVAAAAVGPRAIVVLGGHGGRADHHHANLLLLAAPALGGASSSASAGPPASTASIDVTAWMGSALITVIRRRATLLGAVGSIVSLLPVHGPARGITTDGLTFPLADEDLPAGTSRGVSNRFAAASADIRLSEGVLVAIQPDALEELPPELLAPGGRP